MAGGLRFGGKHAPPFTRPPGASVSPSVSSPAPPPPPSASLSSPADPDAPAISAAENAMLAKPKGLSQGAPPVPGRRAHKPKGVAPIQKSLMRGGSMSRGGGMR